MRMLALFLTAVVMAGCGPSTGISAAQAVDASPRLHPPVVEGDADGHVFEYH